MYVVLTLCQELKQVLHVLIQQHYYYAYFTKKEIETKQFSTLPWSYR